MGEAEKPDTAATTESGHHARIPLFTEAVALAAVSALSYYYAYEFERGYLQYFRVPKDIVSVELVVVIRTISVLVGLVIIALIVSNGIVSYFLQKTNNRLEGLVWFHTYFFIIAFLASILLPWEKAIFNVGLVLALLGMDFIPPIFSKKNGKSYFDRLEDSLSREAYVIPPESHIGRLLQKMGRKLFLLLIVAVIMVPVLANWAGESRARSAQDFLVAEQSANWAMVRAYGEQAIFVEYDPVNKTTTGKFRIVKLGAEGAQEFVLQKIGPLKPSK